MEHPIYGASKNILINIEGISVSSWGRFTREIVIFQTTLEYKTHLPLYRLPLKICFIMT